MTVSSREEVLEILWMPDDRFREVIMPEAEKTADLLRELSVQANSFMLHYGAERGSTDAYRLFLETTRVMYVFGAGLHLKELGYSFQKI